MSKGAQQADGLSQAEPVPVSSVPASIPSAVQDAIWRCGVGVAVEATDRVIAATLKRTRSRAVRSMCEELDKVMQAVVDQTRRPIGILGYSDAFAEHKRIQGIVAQAIEARSGETEGLDPKDESAVRQDAPDSPLTRQWIPPIPQEPTK